VAVTRCQAFGAAVRPQADALGQNLPGGAISSAVEHLPYKEIVTGSIPVSPISKRSAALGFVGFLLQLANARSPGPSPVGWALNSPRRTPSALRIIFRQVSLSAAA
jgi:hypothetical protein